MNNKYIKYIIEHKKIIIPISIILLVSIIFFIFIMFNSKSFVGQIQSENYEEAIELYNTKVKGKTKETEKTKMETLELIDNTLNDFNNNRINYNKAKAILETISRVNLLSTKVDESLQLLDKLNNSKISYNKALEFLKIEEYYNAIISFNDVIEEDTNYSEAQNQSNSIFNTYKEKVLSDLENNTDSTYENKIEELEKLKNIAKNDNEIQAKIEIYKNKQIDELKKNQEVTVVSAKIIKDGYSTGIQAIVKNNTKKVVKNYTIGMLAYDSNGYPLKIDFNGNVELGEAKAVNIQPGKTFGKDKYFSIFYEEDKMHTAIACVKEVEYYDGEKWENPYYDYWFEIYNDKQYKK